MLVEAGQHVDDLLFANAGSTIARSPRERRVPRGIPWVLPRIGHEQHILVDDMQPVGVTPCQRSGGGGGIVSRHPSSTWSRGSCRTVCSTADRRLLGVGRVFRPRSTTGAARGVVLVRLAPAIVEDLLPFRRMHRVARSAKSAPSWSRNPRGDYGAGHRSCLTTAFLVNCLWAPVDDGVVDAVLTKAEAFSVPKTTSLLVLFSQTSIGSGALCCGVTPIAPQLGMVERGTVRGAFDSRRLVSELPRPQIAEPPLGCRCERSVRGLD